MTSSIVLVSGDKSTVFTTSKIVAKEFGRRHDNVLRDIKALIYKLDLFDIDGDLYFKKSIYVSRQNKKLPMYSISKMGYLLLTLGFTGKKTVEKRSNIVEDETTENNTTYYIVSNDPDCETPEVSEDAGFVQKGFKLDFIDIVT